MFLDSNVIIFATQPKHADLRAFIAQHSPSVSAVSYVEVLGYHKHTAPDAANWNRSSPPPTFSR